MKKWKNYATICFRNNTRVQYFMNEKGIIEVRFKTSMVRGLKSIILDEYGNVIRCFRFSPSDIGFYQGFLKDNIPLIRKHADKHSN